jgi:glycosyltransferase involved in cell wall biosynthesis
MKSECDYLLSICIPTFNRAKYLDINLQNLSHQKDIDKVQIVISDNNSQDDTLDVVKKYKQLNIKYFKHEHNIGANKNCDFLITISDGKFSWFMGDDDNITKNSLSRVLIALENNSKIGLLAVDFTAHQGDLSFTESSNKDVKYKKGRELFYFLHLKLQFISINIVNTLKYKRSIIKCQNAPLQERHILQIMDILSNNSAYFLNQKIVQSGYTDHNLSRLGYDHESMFDKKDTLPRSSYWLDLFFRFPKAHIQNGIETLNYDEKSLKACKRSLDKRLILMYLANKKEGKSKNDKFKDICEVFNFNSSKILFLLAYVIPEKSVPHLWLVYKSLERLIKK